MLTALSLVFLGHEAIKLDLVPSGVAGILQGVSNTVAALSGIVGSLHGTVIGSGGCRVLPRLAFAYSRCNPRPKGVPAAAYINESTGSWQGVFFLIVIIYASAGLYFVLRAKAEPVPLATLGVPAALLTER